MAKKIMGIDYGEARTGIAVSDALGLLANGVGNIEERDINRLINKIAEKASELSVEMLVLGNPVNMNGTLGPKSEKVAKLEALNPMSVLTRGFSAVYKNDTLIKSVDDISNEDRIKIRMKDGSFDAVCDGSTIIKERLDNND